MVSFIRRSRDGAVAVCVCNFTPDSSEGAA
jgi:hypothetical protein